MPTYRIVVIEHTAGPKSGSIVEKVGAYNPKTKERALDAERVKYWMSVGAQPSDTVHNMLVSLGIIDAKKINVLPKKSPPKKEEAPAAEAPAEKAPEEAPAAEESKEAAPEEAAPAAEEAPASEASAEEPKKEE